MARIRLVTLVLTLLFPFAVWAGEPTQTLTVESIHILRIIDQEEKATIKLPDGRMHILKVGDSIGKNGKVIEIVEGRIVIEERTERGPGKRGT